jgi:CRP-like cAMP-binding protein
MGSKADGRRGSSGAKRSARDATPRRVAAVTWNGGNRILATLPPKERAALMPHLQTRTLASGEVLYEQGATIDAVYFPETAVTSFVNRMSDGAMVEVGTIGNESMVGLAISLGARTAHSQILAQIPGDALRMSAAAFRSALQDLPRFRTLVAGCTYAFVTQVSQTAACNRLHGIEQRCARWLLLTHDRVGGAGTFPLTHEFLSFMLGVRRAGVTEALGALARSALITSRQGSVTIVDREGLEAASCECYAIVRRLAGEPFNGTSAA